MSEITNVQSWQWLAAQVAHEVNRAYCLAHGDDSIPFWDDTSDELKQGILSGVRFGWDGKRSARDLHANWVKDKVAAGWVYGPVKDFEAKTHPCIVEYDDLPEYQRMKDYLFAAAVRQIARFSESSPE